MRGMLERPYALGLQAAGNLLLAAARQELAVDPPHDHSLTRIHDQLAGDVALADRRPAVDQALDAPTRHTRLDRQRLAPRVLRVALAERDRQQRVRESRVVLDRVQLDPGTPRGEPQLGEMLGLDPVAAGEAVGVLATSTQRPC